MIAALFSFLGGTAFRLVFGGVMDYLNKLQDHKQSLETQRLQNELEDKRHARDIARLKLQSELGVKEIQIAGDVAISKAEMDAFVQAVQATKIVTGIKWVDAWNQTIRPLGATIALTIWVCTMVAAAFVLTEFDQTLISAFLGIFVGERIHKHIQKR